MSRADRLDAAQARYDAQEDPNFLGEDDEDTDDICCQDCDVCGDTNPSLYAGCAFKYGEDL